MRKNRTANARSRSAAERHAAPPNAEGRDATPAGTAPPVEALRPAAETLYADQLAALAEADAAAKAWRPFDWKLSAASTVLFIMGGQTVCGVPITPKYVGDKRLIEACVATLATNRALLLVGEPGTAKSLVSELLGAAISGDSRLLVQGSAGSDEHHLRYTWNYAEYFSNGMSRRALVASAIMRAMEAGQVARIEEFTRMAPEVQDALISILSEKEIPIPELETIVSAKPGFNVIATANDRDHGAHELSAALRRRFNVVRLPTPASKAKEAEIVLRRTQAELARLDLPKRDMALTEPRNVVMSAFRELRGAQPASGARPGRALSCPLSTADAIATLAAAACEGALFQGGAVSPEVMGRHLGMALLREPVRDGPAVLAYADRRLSSGSVSEFERKALKTLKEFAT